MDRCDSVIDFALKLQIDFWIVVISETVMSNDHNTQKGSFASRSADIPFFLSLYFFFCSQNVEFRPDRTTDYGVICPWVFHRLIMGKWCIYASSFIFDRIIINLLVTRTGINGRTSLISGRIRQLTLELLALEWWKFYTFELEYL